MQVKKKLKKPLRYLLYGIGIIMLLVSLFVTTVYFGGWGPIPSSKELQELSQYKASEVYDVNNELLGKFYLADRQPITIDQIPQHTIDALIATEDVRYYEHSGVDTRSFLRVFFKTILLQDASSGGGSTLTQQLAKNLFSRKDYGFLTLPVVKTKEIIIARRLERLYDKQAILALYFNTVPFSGNTYGIESAALKFFNKHTKDLTVSEAATLIGTLKASATYDPRNHPKRSLSRRNTVLSQMKKYDYLSEAAYKNAVSDSLKLNYGTYDEERGIATYFREEVRNRLLKWIEEQSTYGTKINLYTSGLKIYTTLDKTLQLYAEDAVSTHMTQLQDSFEKEYGNAAPWLTNKKIVTDAIQRSFHYKRLNHQGYAQNAIMDSLNKPRKMWWPGIPRDSTVMASTIDSIQHSLKFLNTGMLTLDPVSGAIRTWVGGVDFEKYKFDHISKSKRQVGSTFKPIVYVTALEQGVVPCDYFSAQEVVYENMEGWSPSNSGNVDEKYMNYNMTAALSKSINTVSVKILEKAGIENTIKLASTLGITAKLPEVPSLALGTAEISLLEMAGAYTAFVHKGIPTRPYYLRKIEDSQGKVLAQFEPEEHAKPVFSETNRQLMISMMQAVATSGTARRLKSTYGLPNDIAAKTGTTQSNKDAWFVALTPNLVAVTWVGHDDHRIGFKSTATGQGANAALPIVAKFFQKVNKDSTYNDISRARFQAPSPVARQLLDCPPTKRDGFLKRLFTNPDKKKKKRFKTKN
ncbi:transglycosylase domain-containing protein [Altibacter sp.]|uniref:transglycosylase domain-containing protein n=1 Tax=Altibacter sp. TaxID=2024823 RepID=UPI000C97A570|nr:transglycosylase domain-containing protein [Altibacter sp.]MAP53313.1 penicillin-binding protein [Altibacter sp.]